MQACVLGSLLPRRCSDLLEAGDNRSIRYSNCFWSRSLHLESVCYWLWNEPNEISQHVPSAIFVFNHLTPSSSGSIYFQRCRQPSSGLFPILYTFISLLLWLLYFDGSHGCSPSRYLSAQFASLLLPSTVIVSPPPPHLAVKSYVRYRHSSLILAFWVSRLSVFNVGEQVSILRAAWRHTASKNTSSS